MTSLGYDENPGEWVGMYDEDKFNNNIFGRS